MATMETMRVDDDGAAVVGRGLGLCERRAGSSGAVMKPRPRIEKRSVWRNSYSSRSSSSKALDCLVEVALSPTAALDLSGRNNAGESVATLRTADKHSTTTTPSRADGEGDEAKGKGKDNDDDGSAAMGRYWSCSSAMKPPEPAAAMTPSPSPSPASSLNHRAATGFYQQEQQEHQQQEYQQQEHQQKEQQKEQQQERQREQKLKMKRGLSSSSWSGMSSHRAGRSSSSSSLRVHADHPHSKRSARFVGDEATLLQLLQQQSYSCEDRIAEESENRRGIVLTCARSMQTAKRRRQVGMGNTTVVTRLLRTNLERASEGVRARPVNMETPQCIAILLPKARLAGLGVIMGPWVPHPKAKDRNPKST